MGRRVLRVLLKDGSLEVLNGVYLAVQDTSLTELLCQWVALLRETSMLRPIFEKSAADSVAGLREVEAIGLGTHKLQRYGN